MNLAAVTALSHCPVCGSEKIHWNTEDIGVYKCKVELECDCLECMTVWTVKMEPVEYELDSYEKASDGDFSPMPYSED